MNRIADRDFLKENIVVGKFGVANETKKCLRFFVNERRSQFTGDIRPGQNEQAEKQFIALSVRVLYTILDY